MKAPLLLVAGLAIATSLTAAANAAGSCGQGQPGVVGGCVTSSGSGGQPWVGCSGSSGMLSSTCQNRGPGGIPYKTYAQCLGAGLNAGWRTSEVSWYCSSIALKE